jgi:hypothetical protein
VVSTRRRPVKQIERTRSRKKKTKDFEVDEPKPRVAKLQGSSRRVAGKPDLPGFKARNSTVTSIERSIKDLALRMAESLDALKIENFDTFKTEILSIRMIIGALKGDPTLLFKSSTGKYLNSILSILDAGESRLNLDVDSTREAVKELMKDLARIVVNTVGDCDQFLNEADLVREYVCDPEEEGSASHEMVDPSEAVLRRNMKKTSMRKRNSVKHPMRGTGYLKEHHLMSPSEDPHLRKEEPSFQEPKAEGWPESSKDKGTTRSGKLIAGSGNNSTRMLKPIRHESENIDKAARKPKIDSPEHILMPFKEDLGHHPHHGASSEDLKFREELPDELKQTSRKVLKKIAKELERLHNYSRIKAQDMALRLEGKVLKAILEDPDLKNDSEKLLNAYKGEIVILIRNLSV